MFLATKFNSIRLSTMESYNPQCSNRRSKHWILERLPPDMLHTQGRLFLVVCLTRPRRTVCLRVAPAIAVVSL